MNLVGGGQIGSSGIRLSWLVGGKPPPRMGLFIGRGMNYGEAMPSRGRHQSSSKECLRMIRKVEAFDGVTGVIIGRSYGGKSLGRGAKTGSIRVQREVSGGLKAVTQTAKGVQELFIRIEEGCEKEVWEKIEELSG